MFGRRDQAPNIRPSSPLPLLRRRVAEFQQRANEMNREVQEKQKEVLEGFREKAERVVAKVARQLGLLVVVEKGKGGPTVYSDAALDISTKVIDEFNYCVFTRGWYSEGTAPSA